MAEEPIVHDVHDSKTGTWQYVVADPSTKAAAIIDPVLDFDPASSTVDTKNADALLAIVKEKGYNVQYILETHVHADHLTAASYLQRRLEASQSAKPAIGIGRRITEVQKTFARRYGIPAAEYENAFDKLLSDDENFQIGSLTATAIHLPGHTPDHMGYKIGDNIFSGDSLFNADVGSARCDFPGGDANHLYASAQKLLGYPEHVRIRTGHDYPPEARGSPASFHTVGHHKKENKHLKEGTTQEEFVSWRKDRDATLAEPRLIHQALQVNIRAGRLPKASDGGDRLLHVPLKTGKLVW